MVSSPRIEGVAAIGRCTNTPRGIHATHRPSSAQLAGGTPTICSSHSQTSPSIRCELAIGWGFHYAVGIAYAALYLAISRLVLAFRADAHLRPGVRDRAPCCTVVRQATRARTRFLRGKDAAPERNSHHQHFRACSVGLYLGSISTSFL